MLKMLKSNTTINSNTLPEIPAKTVADEMVQHLRQIGVDFVFGEIGRAHV